ncbi:MAG: putative DNA-binding domain-containing protein [Rhodospirillales bacterium]|nr:putative DNA-binding domain-containing protein [Rhodospirillales bacterium]MCB9973851.1 putative DNA-binding domain-containing protein [Rhodospirillales bacterium]MCB9980492.1 putative DNA-binding domain-containing protein [Rhodospirillales bacterium]
MKLALFQQHFQEELLTPSAAPAGGPGFRDLCIADNIPVSERLRVYQDNILHGLSAKMSERLPVIAALGGDDFALCLLRQYICQSPPQSGCLADYGRTLPDFIAGYAPAAALPYLPDLVKLELEICAAEQAADDLPLSHSDLDMLQQNAESELVYLPLRTSVSLLSSPYQIYELRAYLLSSAQGTEVQPSIVPSTKDTYVLIYRPFLKAEYCTLSPEEYFLLHALKEGVCLNDALSKVLVATLDFDLASFLSANLNRRIFARAVPNSEE